uniref:Uncharacterized protein n=1 Tax=Tanacetum cinerariifolium TaxID=118510 RepID=A0A6L2JHC3_TANCI|nr:hypothetical protein [Tanacetum cinerariifolium]
MEIEQNEEELEHDDDSPEEEPSKDEQEEPLPTLSECGWTLPLLMFPLLNPLLSLADEWIPVDGIGCPELSRLGKRMRDYQGFQRHESPHWLSACLLSPGNTSITLFPGRYNWNHLFQPMFDEDFNHPTIVVSSVPVITAPRAVDLAIHLYLRFEELPKTPHLHDDPLHESLHEDSTSQGSSSDVRPIHTPFESLGRWTKVHPIANMIGDPSRFVSTRKQL